MTLQDDITRYATENTGGTLLDWVAKNITAGLERDYYLVKLADLPEVIEVGHHLYSTGSQRFSCSAIDWVYAHERAVTYLAVSKFLQVRESEAATLARRRDELAREYSPSSLGYDDLGGTGQALINALAAAEDEVARLKAAS